MIYITDTNEKRLDDLQARKGSLSPEEETVRVAILDLDEADENLASAVASHPTPDPVKTAQDAVDAARKEYDAAEAALAAKALAALVPSTPEATAAVAVLTAATK